MPKVIKRKLTARVILSGRSTGKPKVLKAEVTFELIDGKIISTATIQGDRSSTIKATTRNTSLPGWYALHRTARAQLTALADVDRHVIHDTIEVKIN